VHYVTVMSFWAGESDGSSANSTNLHVVDQVVVNPLSLAAKRWHPSSSMTDFKLVHAFTNGLCHVDIDHGLLNEYTIHIHASLFKS
jgi:hypothetical protein